jgi:hypothetical protein
VTDYNSNRQCQSEQLSALQQHWDWPSQNGPYHYSKTPKAQIQPSLMLKAEQLVGSGAVDRPKAKGTGNGLFLCFLFFLVCTPVTRETTPHTCKDGHYRM